MRHVKSVEDSLGEYGDVIRDGSGYKFKVPTLQRASPEHIDAACDLVEHILQDDGIVGMIANGGESYEYALVIYIVPTTREVI